MLEGEFEQGLAAVVFAELYDRLFEKKVFALQIWIKSCRPVEILFHPMTLCEQMKKTETPASTRSGKDGNKKELGSSVLLFGLYLVGKDVIWKSLC